MVKPACETGNCQVYKKADIPEEYRLKNNDRVAPIMVVAKEGWLLQTNGSNNYNPKTTSIVFLQIEGLVLQGHNFFTVSNFRRNARL